MIHLSRSWAFVAGADSALSEARDIDQAAALMLALAITSLVQMLSGNYAAADTQSKELVALADKKGAAIWKGFGMMN